MQHVIGYLNLDPRIHSHSQSAAARNGNHPTGSKQVLQIRVSPDCVSLLAISLELSTRIRKHARCHGVILVDCPILRTWKLKHQTMSLHHTAAGGALQISIRTPPPRNRCRHVYLLPHHQQSLKQPEGMHNSASQNGTMTLTYLSYLVINTPFRSVEFDKASMRDFPAHQKAFFSPEGLTTLSVSSKLSVTSAQPDMDMVS